MLDDATFKTNLKALLKENKESEKGSDHFAEKLVDLIKTYITGATVTVAAGIHVTTAGSATAQTGATDSTGTGTIS